jgi:hypothetical protein
MWIRFSEREKNNKCSKKDIDDRQDHKKCGLKGGLI